MAVPVGPQQAGGWFGGWFGGPTVEAGGATTAARGAAPTMPAGGATATAAAGGEATAAGAATTEAGGAMEGALSMEEELRAAASCPRAPTTASEENITLIAAEKIVGFQILEQTYYLVRGKFVPEADADFDYDDKASNPTTEHWMTKADFIDKIKAGHEFEEQRSLLELTQGCALQLTTETLDAARAAGLGGTRHCARADAVTAATQAAYDAALATGSVEMDPGPEPPEPDTEEGAAIARVAASIAELAARRAAQLAAPPPPPPSEELRQTVDDRVIDSVIAERVS